MGFSESRPGAAIPWPRLERWTRTRAVTVADIAASLAVPELEIALTADLVFMREGTRLLLPAGHRPPSAGLVWALGRAGRGALARGLLTDEPVTASEAVDLGLAHGVLEDGDRLPVPGAYSVAAATAARDLMRARAGDAAGLALEEATFRLLFAVGDANEGARAFLERRQPDFET